MEFRDEEKKQGIRLTLPKVVALCLVFLVVGLLLGSTSQFFVGPIGANILSRLGLPINPNIARLLAVQNLVLERHLNPNLDPNLMMENAVRGLLSRVDGGFTRFENQQEAQQTSEQAAGEYAGIGVTVRLVEEQVHIESVFRGSPAQAIGVLPRDIIIAVENQSIRGLALNDVTSRIKGPVGTPVTITVFRPSKNTTLNFTITRARIVVPVVDYQVLSPDFAHVTLTQFTTTATEQMRQALTDLEQQGIKHVLLDLRFNPGGYTNVAEAIADFFLDPNLTIYKTVDRNGRITEYKTRANKLYSGQVSVLINQGSASASELITGALRDHLGAKVLGVTSYGKGTIQQGFGLGDGSRVWITVQAYKTPKGAEINKVGITPDVIIEQPDPASPKDKQLEDAIQYVKANLLR